MEVDIDLEELVEAYEKSDMTHHYFIDTKNNEIIVVNETADDASDKLGERDSTEYIAISSRSPEDDDVEREMFVYTIMDFDLAEKIHDALDGKKQSKSFEDLLYEYPKLREKWSGYKHKIIKNETINWLCENNIELKDQQLTPKIEIREMSKGEIKNLPEELEGFGPFACLRCHNKTGIKARWFTVNLASENRLIEKKIQRIMKEKFGINHYGNFSGKREFLTAAKCPKCGSENIFWDF